MVCQVSNQFKQTMRNKSYIEHVIADHIQQHSSGPWVFQDTARTIENQSLNINTVSLVA